MRTISFKQQITFIFLVFPIFPSLFSFFVAVVYNKRYYPKQQNMYVLCVYNYYCSKALFKWVQNNIVVNFSIYDLWWKYVSTFMMFSSFFFNISYKILIHTHTHTRYIRLIFIYFKRIHSRIFIIIYYKKKKIWKEEANTCEHEHMVCLNNILSQSYCNQLYLYMYATVCCNLQTPHIHMILSTFW